MKRTASMNKLVRYECEKCNKLWGLQPEQLILSGKGPIFCGYDGKGNKNWRKEGHCHCGRAFSYPFTTVTKLHEQYGKAWAHSQDGE